MTRPASERVSKVKEGAVVEWRNALGTERQKAKPACSDNKGGRWICKTHRKVFDNQFQKDTHIGVGEAEHVLAWLCFVHGVEVP